MGLKKYVACHGSFLTASCLKCKKKRTAEDIRVSTHGGARARTGIRSFALLVPRPPLLLLALLFFRSGDAAVIAVSFVGVAVLLGSSRAPNITTWYSTVSMHAILSGRRAVYGGWGEENNVLGLSLKIFFFFFAPARRPSKHVVTSSPLVVTMPLSPRAPP